MVKKRIELFVPGDPQSKQRPRHTNKGYAITPTKTRDYEHELALLYDFNYPDTYYEKTQLELSIYAGFKKPKGYKEGTPTNISPKDLDNIYKIVGDALNKAAYDDDAWIVHIKDIMKFYADNPGVLIVLQEKKNLKCPDRYKNHFFNI